ncbi:hypothetical protein L873DRAFT_1840024 [Choiromyces venosus 120613-1]|uniref:Uncharacterized protein n=1 Tax=Choiromyces venosus 120613-1 TaxID=1336337 RepID=A0A3N4K8E3_9PEZI|nr:hypothetical protein L873DRAFT_1840024 [Choiromyces venosus 120613-1]
MDENDVPSVTLYPEAVAMAIATIIYTAGSAAAAGFTHMLFRLNGKQVVYVSLLSLSIFIQQLFTITHEIVNLVLWPALQIEVYEAYIKQWRNPNASIAYESSPNIVVKTIFAIRTYFFNAESLLFFFWSLMLFVSIWEIQSRVLKSDRFIAGSKWICFLLPAVQVILANLPQVRKVTALYLALCNCTMVTTCTLGSIFLLLILIRCIHVMWSASWTYKVRQWRPYDHRPPPPPPHQQQRPKTTHSITSTTSTTTTSDSEDRYILTRFIAGFLIIGGLQTSFLLSQYFYAKDVIARKSPLAEKPHLGWTAKQQLVDWSYFLASGSTGYLILIVFGTTRESRRQMRRLMAEIRRFCCCGGGRGGRDEEYVSFRAEVESIGEDGGGSDGGRRRRGSDSDGSSSDGTGGRRRAPPPKPMTFVSSRTTPLGSPGEYAGNKESPAGFSVVDLKTPARSTHRGKCG